MAGLFGAKSQAAESLPADSTTNSQNMALLSAALNFDPNPLRGGGEITIEGDALAAVAGPAGTLADVRSSRPAGDQISIYIVRPGDTLSHIALMFDVSVNTIRWANDIPASGTIRIGQVLTILPVDGIKYTVKKGDTLSAIAKKFKADAEEIANYNLIAQGSELEIGSEIIIPDGVITPPPAPRLGSLVRGNGGPSLPGYFIHPLLGARKTQGLHGRNGVDFGAPFGTPVIASASGQVIVARSAGWNGGYGVMTVINHPNNTQTLYAHMSKLEIWQGQSIVQGQVIGYIGCSGRCTGPHLHFEVRGARNPF